MSKVTQILRQKVLNLAISGKLSPVKSSKDEIKELRRTIFTEKQKLLKDGKLDKSLISNVDFDNSEKTIAYNDENIDFPDSWPLIRLDEVLTNVQYGLSNSAENNGNLKLLRITDIKNSAVDWNDVPFTNEDNYEQYVLKNNDIVFARTGSVGKSYLVKEPPENAVFASYLIRIQTIGVLPEFIKLFFETPLYWDQIASNAKGTGRLNCNSQVLKKLILPLPSLEEQKLIVESTNILLKQIDNLELQESELLKNIELLKQKMIDLEIQKDFDRNQNYDLIPLKELCHSLKYGTSKKALESGKIPVIRMGNLQGGEIDWTDLKYSSDESDIRKYFLSKDDVLFNRTNSAELVGKTAIYRGEHPAIYAGYLIKIDYDKRKLNGEFLNFVLNSSLAKDYCQRVKTDGVNQSNVNAQKLGAFKIPVPSLEKQLLIVKKLNSLNNELKTFVQYL